MALPVWLMSALVCVWMPVGIAREAFARGLTLGVAGAAVTIVVCYRALTTARYAAAFVDCETCVTFTREGVSVEIPGLTRQVFRWRSFSGFQETRSSFVLLSRRYPRRHVWKRFFTDEQTSIRALLKWHVGRDDA